MKKIEIFRIMETTYEDGSYWIEYIVNGKFGYEIVYNIEDLEKNISEEEVIELLKEEYSSFSQEIIDRFTGSKEAVERWTERWTPIFNAKKYYENLFNSDIELNKRLTSKLKISVCSDTLRGLIEDCRQSDNEMWYIDQDFLKEEFGDDKKAQKLYTDKIQEEVNSLGVQEYFQFDFYDSDALIVYGGAITQFLFGSDNKFEFEIIEDRTNANGSKTIIYENEYYKLKKNIKDDYMSISIEAKDKIDNYRHNIYAVENSDTFEITGFEIQTTSYGALSVNNIEKVIEAYNIAISTVKELEKMFLQ